MKLHFILSFACTHLFIALVLLSFPCLTPRPRAQGPCRKLAQNWRQHRCGKRLQRATIRQAQETRGKTLWTPEADRVLRRPREGRAIGVEKPLHPPSDRKPWARSGCPSRRREAVPPRPHAPTPEPGTRRHGLVHHQPPLLDRRRQNQPLRQSLRSAGTSA